MPEPRPPVRRRKVSETVVRAIQAQILSGQLKPGDQLPPERQLADLFGASRGSVREALRALELSGLIRSRQGGGNFVADLPPSALTAPLEQFLARQRQSLRDLYEARQMLEPRLAFLAAERATQADVERLRLALAEQERTLEADAADAAHAADRAFHQAIAEATRNQAFIKLHNFLSDLVAESRREAVDTAERRRQALIDHRSIAEAIARGDGPAASAAMLQHLRNVEAIVLAALEGYRAALARLPGVAAEGREGSGLAAPRPDGEPGAAVDGRGQRG